MGAKSELITQITGRIRRSTSKDCLAIAESLIDRLGCRSSHRPWEAQILRDAVTNEDLMESLQRLVGRLRHRYHMTITDLTNELSTQLDTIKKDSRVARVAYLPRSGLLKITTKKIILEKKVDFGGFIILLRLGGRYKPEDIFIYPIKPYLMPGEYSICHPHLQLGKMCFGGGQPSIRNAITAVDVVSALDIILTGLNEYNPRSPYKPLEDWPENYKRPVTKGKTKCLSCGSWVDNTKLCYSCESIQICEHCGLSCDSCSNKVCPKCLLRPGEYVLSTTCNRCLVPTADSVEDITV